ncbi:146_t:CDS:2, partial [Paraglomus occultum]
QQILDVSKENLGVNYEANKKAWMTANTDIHFDDTIETEAVIIDKKEIIEEILHTSNSDSYNEGSDIEIEKISHSVALEQCKLLLQYVEQQDPPNS